MDDNYNELLKSKIRGKREELSAIEELKKDSLELIKKHMSALAQHLNGMRETIEQRNLISLDMSQCEDVLHPRVILKTKTDIDIKDWFELSITYNANRYPFPLNGHLYCVFITDPNISEAESFRSFEDLKSVMEFIINRCSMYIAKHLK